MTKEFCVQKSTKTETKSAEKYGNDKTFWLFHKNPLIKEQI